MRRMKVVPASRKKKKTLARLTLNERKFADLKFSAIFTIYVRSTCVAIDGYFVRIYVPTYVYIDNVIARIRIHLRFLQEVENIFRDHVGPSSILLPFILTYPLVSLFLLLAAFFLE